MKRFYSCHKINLFERYEEIVNICSICHHRMNRNISRETVFVSCSACQYFIKFIEGRIVLIDTLIKDKNNIYAEFSPLEPTLICHYEEDAAMKIYVKTIRIPPIQYLHQILNILFASLRKNA